MTQKKAKILIVDDMPANIKILVDALREEYRISVAKNGAEAIALVCSDEAPDLVLLDVVMPQMDGYEVCAKLQADSKAKRIPVIFITSLDSDEDEAKGLELGAVDFITKPFSMPIVKARIRTHLHLRAFERSQAKLITELKEALDQVKTLNGLLPICANCKKIRDDKGYWNQIECYVSEHSMAEFSHSICPECAEDLYPGFVKDEK